MPRRARQSLRLSPADAETRWLERQNGDGVSSEACGGAHSFPIPADERACDGHRAIVLHKRMQAGHFGEEAKEMVGNGRAREIVDEPAEPGVELHPSEEANHVRLVEVMRKQ